MKSKKRVGLEPDPFFNAEQINRLKELMRLWRLAENRSQSFSPHLQTELTELVEVEIKATAERAKTLIQEQ